MLDKEIMNQIYEIVDGFSFYPNMPRKERKERIQDNIKWYKEHGYINISYNHYGLDIKNFRDPEDYLEKWIIKTDRTKTHHENIDPFLHRMILNNKVNFYSYLESIVPGCTPKMYMVINGPKIYLPISKYKDSAEAFEDLPNGKYACKASIGSKGENFYILVKNNNEFFLNKENCTIETLINILSGGRFVIQEFVIQNNEFGKIAPNSLNTIRIETLRYHEDTHIYYALARFSATEDAIIDNASQGGTFVGIDIDKGTLREFGEYTRKPVHDTTHPISGITYKDFKLPYWNEIIDLIKKLHPLFYGVPSIGWDIALTDKGPIIIEINWTAGTRIAQMANGGLKKRYLQLKEM